MIFRKERNGFKRRYTIANGLYRSDLFNNTIVNKLLCNVAKFINSNI